MSSLLKSMGYKFPLTCRGANWRTFARLAPPYFAESSWSALGRTFGVGGGAGRIGVFDNTAQNLPCHWTSYASSGTLEELSLTFPDDLLTENNFLRDTRLPGLRSLTLRDLDLKKLLLKGLHLMNYPCTGDHTVLPKPTPNLFRISDYS